MSRHSMPRGGNKAGTPDKPEATTEETQEAAITDTAEETVGDTTEETTTEATGEPDAAQDTKRRVDWSRVLAYGILPGLALVLALAAGYLKWQHDSVDNANAARAESVQTAKDSTVAMLSYKPDTVGQQLNDARDLLTGEFRDSYTSLINDVVIPGAQEQQISAVATVPAAASVSADPNHAVVLVFVNQTVVVGDDAPTDTASSVRVGLEKVGDRWLISQFDPV
ncbi:hypothetical protein [Mycolicibacterium pulveris]|uniref:hypothetical protein n=1 Tax=Mycolicibacterium pulveris TaxID=36813 RepID=UPI003CE8A2F4